MENFIRVEYNFNILIGTPLKRIFIVWNMNLQFRLVKDDIVYFTDMLSQKETNDFIDIYFQEVYDYVAEKNYIVDSCSIGNELYLRVNLREM